MIFAIDSWFAMFDCFQTLNKNKINSALVKELECDMLTVSQNTKPLTYSWSTENVKEYKKERVILIPKPSFEFDSSQNAFHNVWLLKT